MKRDSKTYAAFMPLMQSCLSHIGPKELLDQPDRALLFEDNLMRDPRYFSGGYLLKQLIIDRLPGDLRKKVNEATAYTLFDRLCTHLYGRIKGREGTINQTLDKSLTEDDVESAAALFEEALMTSQDTYQVTLVTNLLMLRDIDLVRVGDVLLRPVNNALIENWPDSCGPTEKRGLLLSLLSNSSNYPSKDSFLEATRDYAAVEVLVEGTHLDEEQSLVFESAVAAFKRLFAYLCICQFFFSNVHRDPYKIETKDLPPESAFAMTDPRGRQHYYLRKLDDPTFLRAVDTRWKSVTFSRRTFILTDDLIRQLKDRCCLDKFNDLFKKDGFGEIKNKVARCLDWYFKAEFESDLTDEALSLFISLEALLSPGGGDPLMSHTDDMAENVAIMMQSTLDERYERKKSFKERYRLRNKIAHHGAVLDRDADWGKIRDLRADTVWSIRGILTRLDEILKYGNDTSAIRQYFEREKLRGGL
jgi:hypothetical protein